MVCSANPNPNPNQGSMGLLRLLALKPRVGLGRLLEHGVKADARHPLPLGQLPLEVEAYDHHLG